MRPKIRDRWTFNSELHNLITQHYESMELAELIDIWEDEDLHTVPRRVLRYVLQQRDGTAFLRWTEDGLEHSPRRAYLESDHVAGR